MTCELCGNDRWSEHLSDVTDYLSGETMSIRRCGECDLFVTDPMPGEDVIDRYYPPRYRTDRQKFSAGMRVRRRAAAAGDPRPGGRGRLLDIGCGSGEFAVEMHRRGWETAVTEIDPHVLDALRARGIDAKNAEEAARLGFEEPFDVITCWHVLEHVEHPLALTKWARAQLKPDGVFQVSVPNLASWQARMFGRDWLHLDVPRHCYHFTPRTLTRVLHDGGFEITRMSSFALEYDVFGVIQSALNRACQTPNVLFEHLTARRDGSQVLPKRDLAMSYALAPVLAAVAVPLALISWLARRGATLTATCRARAPSREAKRSPG